jgi:rhamnose transport system substrate-binding protein
MFMPRFVGIPIFTDNGQGAEEAAKTTGDQITYTGPTSANAALQQPFLQTAAAKGYNAVIFNPADPNALVPTLQELKRKGVKVVTYDGDITDGALRDLYIGDPDPKVIGETLAGIAGQQIGYKGEIAIVSATPEAVTSNAWNYWIQQTLKTPKFSGMKLEKIEYGNDDDATSAADTKALLLAYPNLKAIIATSGVAVASVARVLTEQGRCVNKPNGIVETGLGAPSSMRSYILSGCVRTVALWNEYDFGYLAEEATHALLSGEITGKAGQTFIAGKLGKRTIGANQTIPLGKLLIIDKANVNTFNF